MSKLRRFILSEKAIEDLQQIADYGRKFFAKETNQRFQAGLKRLFMSLRDPQFELGSRRDEIKPNLLMFPYQRYNLYFYRTADAIIILRILRSDVDTLDPLFFEKLSF